MNTIYLDQDVWTRGGGEQLGRAVGETAGLGVPEVRVPLSGEGKVIDLAAWKAENVAEFEELDEPEAERAGGLGEYQGRVLVRRRRRKYEDALIKGELAATLSVVGVMAALMLRVLVF